VISESKILLDYYGGIREQQKSKPCTVCAEGTVSFMEFPHFHGTDFTKCSRAVQFKKFMAPEQFSDQKLSEFRDGHVHEAAMVETLRAAGYTIDHRHDSPTKPADDQFVSRINLKTGKCQTWVGKSNLQIRRLKLGDQQMLVIGHTDGVINGRYILECKAVKDYAFKNKFNKAHNLQVNYVRQVQAYLYFHDLEGGILLGKSRTHSTPAPFWIDRDDAYVINKARDLYQIQLNIHNDSWLPCKPVMPAEVGWCQACKKLKGMNL
jgi:hypothetical protein